jgi:hypothetical protein
LACQEEIKLHRCSPEPNKGGKMREKKNQHSAHSNKPLVTKEKKNKSRVSKINRNNSKEF